MDTSDAHLLPMSNISRTGSIEFKDAVINEKWVHSANRRKGHLTPKNPEKKRGWFGEQKSEEEKLMERVEQHELEELQTFIAQKLFRVDGILCDEQTRILLVEKMMNAKEYPTIEHEELVHRYGSSMAGWLRDRLVPTMADCSSVLQRAASEFYKDKMSDPLCNWGQMNTEHVAMVAARIAKFSEEMSSKVKWSLLVEPGKFSCHLTEFVLEYNRLERMFTNNELSDEEASQTAFNANYLTKARSKMVPCADYTRVRLEDGLGRLDDRNELMDGMFSGEHEFQKEVNEHSTYGTTDFIHANYIRGGPLLNTFICAQAPLRNTQEDFWRMVFQEKCQFIVMLNSAVDSSTLGPLDSANRMHCPYYWPRAENQFLEFGVFRVTCMSVNSKADPLFTITKLKVQRMGGALGDEDEDDDELVLEHWQWDWQYLGDAYWPFRVLRKLFYSAQFYSVAVLFRASSIP
uniref:Tyrosine-protein phosphatase domain-containing protein n=1 Tax=Caenorhabditis japonica TaxID=281687 RepID=A0A8R1DX48_CAEJA